VSEDASKHLKWGKADKKKLEMYDISRSKSCKRVIYYKQFDSFGKKEEGIQNNTFFENNPNAKTFYAFDANRLLIYDSKMNPIVIIPKDAIICESVSVSI
jgi:hypothetical protein